MRSQVHGLRPLPRLVEAHHDHKLHACLGVDVSGSMIPESPWNPRTIDPEAWGNAAGGVPGAPAAGRGRGVQREHAQRGALCVCGAAHARDGQRRAAAQQPGAPADI